MHIQRNFYSVEYHDFLNWFKMTLVNDKGVDMILRRFVMYQALGLCFFIVGFITTLCTTLGGHGSYFFAKLFFPYSMYAVLFTEFHIGPYSFALAIIQYPLYSFLAFVLHNYFQSIWKSIACVIAIHMIAAAICVFTIIPGF